MLRDDEPGLATKPKHSGLESYRRLIELQKQMIELSRQHEESKRECAALRDRVTREMTSRIRTRKTLRHRIQRSASTWLKRVPGVGLIETKLGMFISKQVTPC
jgi:hypothetical protein